MGINYKDLEIVDQYAKENNKELLIVTKKRSQKDILELISLGFRYFGENKVQEANSKFPEIISNHKIKLSLIGPLHSNKVKLSLNIFDEIQSIDRKKIVDEIIKFRTPKTKTKNFFIQVNIGDENQKSGVNEKDIYDFYKYCLDKELFIKGIMCIPPNNEDPSFYFQKMNLIKDQLNKNIKLSMGMSSDYKIAIKFNTDLIRIGSLLFNDKI